MLQSCLVCYKDYNYNSRSEQAVNKGQEVLIHFFKFLGRYLDDDIHRGGNGSSEFNQLPFEQLIQAGILACKDCSKLAESFCELYSKMKCIELQVNSKLQTLTDAMSHAGKVPARIKNFRESIDQLQIEDCSAANVLDSKMDLVKKCAHKLQKAFPKLEIKKCNSFSVSSEREEFSSSFHTTYLKVEISNSASTVGKRMEHESHGKCLKSSVVKKEPNDSQSESYCQNEADEDFGGEANDDDYSAETEHPSAEHFRMSLCPSNKPTCSTSTSVQQIVEGYLSVTPNHSINTVPKKSTRQRIQRARKAALTPLKVEPVASSERPRESRNPETGKYKCSDCPQEFSNTKGLRRHCNSVHRKLRFQCPECNKIFTRREHYNRHYDNIHMGLKFRCPICNKCFPRKDKLSNHQMKSACGSPGGI